VAARAIWKGVLQIGNQEVPVKLYSGAQDRTVRFHLLHDADKARVQQRMVHPATGDTVRRGEARTGVEVEPGTFVLLEEGELENLEPEASRDIAIKRFVPRSAVDPRWYSRPYYLGPEDGATAPRYFALAQALARKQLAGVARWTMRKRSYAGALLEHDGYLTLVAMHYAEEVLPLAEVTFSHARSIDERERKLAHQLMDTLAGEFDPSSFRDEYRDRLLELIERKRKGDRSPLRLVKFQPKDAGERSLADMLAASLKKAS
jgi:DNA end-binding protein Ku